MLNVRKTKQGYQVNLDSGYQFANGSKTRTVIVSEVFAVYKNNVQVAQLYIDNSGQNKLV
jgi:hypothetical protein